MKNLNYYSKILLKQKNISIFLMIITLILDISRIIIPMFIINNIITKNLDKLIFFSILELLVFSAFFIFRYFYENYKERYLEDIKVYIIKDLIHNILKQKNEHIKNTEKYISWIIKDTSIIKENYFSNLYKLYYESFFLISSLIILLYFSIYLFIINLVGIVIIGMFSKSYSKRIEDVDYNISKANENKIKYTTNLFQNIYKFYFSNAATNFISKLEEHNNTYRKEFIKNIKKFNTEMFKPVFITMIIQVLNILITAFLIFTSTLRFGTFQVIATLSGFLTNSVQSIIMAYYSIKNSKKIFEKYSNEIIPDNKAINSIDKIENIEFKNVSLTLNDKTIFNNLNLNIKKGKKYLIIGESGKGKSTIISLILKSISDYTGSVLINQIDLKDIDKKSIYEQIDFIDAKNLVLYSTIHNNISLFEDTVDKNKINKILEKLNISNIENEVKEDNLSLGQKQRLNLARLFYNNKDFIILDEATSNLDEENRKNIEEELLKSNNTVIIITHHYDENYKKKFDSVIEL